MANELCVVECTDGLIAIRGDRCVSLKRSLEAALPAWSEYTVLVVKLHDMSIDMANQFMRHPVGQDVIDCLCRPLDEESTTYSFTQLIMMEAAQLLVVLRSIGRFDKPDTSRTLETDLRSCRRELDRILQTGAITNSSQQ